MCDKFQTNVKDHPRVCGEQFIPALVFTRKIGSPPRVRGTAVSGKVRRLWDRITPACAGNSIPRLQGHIQHQDHPRVCGEQDGDTYGNLESEGSPPRVRGTALLLRFYPRRLRITPACAGNRFKEAAKVILD